MKPALIATIMLTLVVYLAPRSQGKQTTGQRENGTDNQPFTPSNQIHSQTKTETADDDPPDLNEAPEWSLVIIALITAIVIGWQSCETRRSANALVASERAWIEGEITEHTIVGVKRYALIVRNKGKTPAHIFRYDVWHGPTRDNAKLLKRSLDTFGEDVSIFVGSGESRDLRNTFDMDEIFKRESGQIADSEGVPKGAFWVQITYGILIESKRRWRKQKNHTTSFAYLYDLTFSTIGRAPKYNEYT